MVSVEWGPVRVFSNREGSLVEDGLITEKEYKAARRKVLKSADDEVEVEIDAEGDVQPEVVE